MQKWSPKYEIEMSIGTFQASRDGTEVKIYKIKWKKFENEGKIYIVISQSQGSIILGTPS